MKLILLPSFFLSIVASAQISISSTDMPVNGDTLRFSTVLPTTSIDYLSTGANYNWDFSDLVPESQGLDEYKLASSVNFTYGLFFGMNAYGIKIIESIGTGQFQFEDVFDFFSNNNSRFRAEGRGLTFQGLPIPSNYSDEDEIYQFPLNYGDRDSSTFKVKFSVPSLLDLYQYGYRINEVEGWGTITTPFGTFEAIKVKSIIYRTDSVVLSQLPFPIAIPSVNYEYKWLAKNQHLPILQVNLTEAQGTSQISQIKYRDNYRGLVNPNTVSENFVNRLKIFPNPNASKFLYIQDAKNVYFELFDFSGKLIFNQLIDSDFYQIKLPELQKGIYIAKSSKENNLISVNKIIVE